jgi:hypothetical protein
MLLHYVSLCCCETLKNSEALVKILRKHRCEPSVASFRQTQTERKKTVHTYQEGELLPRPSGGHVVQAYGILGCFRFLEVYYLLLLTGEYIQASAVPHLSVLSFPRAAGFYSSKTE